MEFAELKRAIKVDYDDDDDYITLLMDAAEEYITDAVGEYNDDDPRHRLLLVALVDAAYRERAYTVTKPDQMSHIIRSIGAQLREGW